MNGFPKGWSISFIIFCFAIVFALIEVISQSKYLPHPSEARISQFFGVDERLITKVSHLLRLNLLLLDSSDVGLRPSHVADDDVGHVSLRPVFLDPVLFKESRRDGHAVTQQVFTLLFPVFHSVLIRPQPYTPTLVNQWLKAFEFQELLASARHPQAPLRVSVGVGANECRLLTLHDVNGRVWVSVQ